MVASEFPLRDRRRGAFRRYKGMGASISKLFSGIIWGKKEIRILILGLVRINLVWDYSLVLIFWT